MGSWGSLGSPPQKGVTSYSLSSNRQAPLAGTLHNAIFNTWRRFRNQVLFVVPPFVAAYMIIGWAKERYVWNLIPCVLLHSLVLRRVLWAGVGWCWLGVDVLGGLLSCLRRGGLGWKVGLALSSTGVMAR